MDENQNISVSALNSGDVLTYPPFLLKGYHKWGNFMRTAVYFLVPPSPPPASAILLSHLLFVSIVSGRPVSAAVTAHNITWIRQCLLRNTKGRPAGIFVFVFEKVYGK
jgi:hypothetical protein